MTLEAFASSPWKNSYGAYDDSPFNVRPAPEFATAEAIVASLYRALGFAGVSEGSVPASGREFDRATQTPGHSAKAGSSVGNDTWRTVLHGVLESPKQPNQSKKRFLQLCPIVPDVALYSGSARLAGNSWNPGQLVQRMICLGSATPSEAQSRWARLYDAMGVGSGDDVWAQWVEDEFATRRKNGIEWKLRDIDLTPDIPVEDKARIVFPAKQLTKDLDSIISAKDNMTRRQWISLLEAVLRLGSVMHVLWLCEVNERLWYAAKAILAGGNVPSPDEVCDTILTLGSPYLSYGNPAVPRIREQAALYLQARIGLNLVMWHLDLKGHAINSLSSSREIVTFLTAVSGSRTELLDAGLLQQFDSIRDEETRTLACKKGIGSNIVEFCRHVLGQRQAANETLRGYDQGFVLRKRGQHSSAPWVVSLGPASVLAFVHCCLREAVGPRSVQRLSAHLRCYGFAVSRDDIAGGDLGRQLRMLGLILDSPDAETGMLLAPPFEIAATA